MSATKGKLLIFSAPSGSGKSTLVNYLLSRIPDLAFSISATSRLPRGNEVDGKEYYFLNLETFKQRVAKGDFLEWEEVYPGSCYGTLLSEVERLRNEGKHVVFDVDVVGGNNIKKHYGEEALAIFVKVPSKEVLRQRLVNRGTDDEPTIQKRLDKAEWEINYAADKFDVTIVNDVLEKAQKEIYDVVIDFLNR